MASSLHTLVTALLETEDNIKNFKVTSENNESITFHIDDADFSENFLTKNALTNQFYTNITPKTYEITFETSNNKLSKVTLTSDENYVTYYISGYDEQKVPTEQLD